MSVGIKETKELLSALTLLSVAVVSKVKASGVVKGGFEVVEMFLNDEEFQTALIAAVDGAASIPAEAADIDFAEALELSKEGVSLVKAVISAAAPVAA
jgi:hypothetical protein